MDNFLIIRLSSLGDIIHTLPAFAALRKGYPAARITWVVEKAGKEILDLVSGIDRIVVRGEKGWIRAIRGGSGTAIDFQGLLKSAVITRLSGARTRLGFSGKNLREPAASVFYTDRLEPFPEDGHVIDKNLKLLSRVGLAAGGYRIPDRPSREPPPIRRGIRLAGLGRNPGQKLVLCNVGAAWESKRWAAERWIELIERIRGTGVLPSPPLGKRGRKGDRPTDRRGDGNSPGAFFLHPGGSGRDQGIPARHQRRHVRSPGGRGPGRSRPGHLRADEPEEKRLLPRPGQNRPVPNGVRAVL